MSQKRCYPVRRVFEPAAPLRSGRLYRDESLTVPSTRCRQVPRSQASVCSWRVRRLFICPCFPLTSIKRPLSFPLASKSRVPVSVVRRPPLSSASTNGFLCARWLFVVKFDPDHRDCIAAAARARTRRLCVGLFRPALVHLRTAFSMYVGSSLSISSFLVAV